MTDRNELLRKLASVRRDLENLEDEVSTAVGVMPESNDPSDAGKRNFETALKRVENAEELAGDVARKLRSVLKNI